MKLEKLLSAIPHTVMSGSPRVEIKDLALDSRQVRSGYLFVALAGETTDGHLHIRDAVQRGAAAVMVSKPGAYAGNEVCTVAIDGSIHTVTALAHAFYGQPACKLIGVTGTNGKTTTSYLVRALLERAGIPTGLIGTVAYEFGDRHIPASRTTPDVFELYRLLTYMSAAGAQAVVMEVSSHALEQQRVGNLLFDVGVFTNLTQDHLDYHRTMEAYFAAKAKLFSQLRGADAKGVERAAVIAIDDDYGRRLAAQVRAAGIGVTTFGAAADADVRAAGIVVSPSLCEFDLHWRGRPTQRVQLNMIGRHNISNCIGALAAAAALGISPEEMVSGLTRMPSVPGRLEFIENSRGFLVVVDYAHTDDALHKALICLRELKPRKLIVVFGCGGDRDKTKRPKMGRVAEELADLAIITSDNPRSENPAAIIVDIQAGMSKKTEVVCPDRRAAIAAAMDAARPGDIVLIAGKGHETYQIINRVFYDFDDRVVARELVRAKEGERVHA